MPGRHRCAGLNSRLKSTPRGNKGPRRLLAGLERCRGATLQTARRAKKGERRGDDGARAVCFERNASRARGALGHVARSNGQREDEWPPAHGVASGAARVFAGRAAGGRRSGPGFERFVGLNMGRGAGEDSPGAEGRAARRIGNVPPGTCRVRCQRPETPGKGPQRGFQQVDQAAYGLRWNEISSGAGRARRRTGGAAVIA